MTGPKRGKPSRRGFFQAAVARVVEPVIEYLGQRFGDLPERPHLYPPGAIDEATFLATCYRCGSCVNACPANAIFLLDQNAGDAAGAPVIDPDRAACVLCKGLPCTQACVSGALRPLSDPGLVRMGIAELYGPLCVRSRGETCALCVERCPIGPAAIRFPDDGPPEILPTGCVGCGVCQHCCPTTPKAIVVKPG
jgi:ferredoxin